MIKVTDFTKYPGGRFVKDGPGSGEQFRRDVLLPAFKQSGKICVLLEGAYGYPISFLEEAFGGLTPRPKLSIAVLLLGWRTLSWRCHEVPVP